MLEAADSSSSTTPPVSRFRVFLAALGAEICAGSIYVVSLYLPEVQKLWFPDDPAALSKAESLAFACNLGNWIPLGGLFYDSKFGGARNTILVACILTAIGYGGLWVCSIHVPVGGYSDAGKLWLLRACWFAWGHGSSYFDGAAVATTAHNFSAQRGSALGVVKAALGLSGSLLTQPYMCFFARPGGAPAFLGFLAVFLTSLGACTLPVIRTVHVPRALLSADEPQRRLRTAGLIILVLALLMAAFGVLRAINLTPPAAAYVGLVVAVLGVFSLLTVARGATIITKHGSALLPPRDDDGDIDDAIPTTSGGEKGAKDVVVAAMPPPPSLSSTGRAATSLSDGSLWHNLRTSTFYLLFVGFFAGTGGGLIFTNHIAFIVLAQSSAADDGNADAAAAAAQRTSTALISLFSVFSAVGRLGAGLGSDHLRAHIHRPAAFGLALVTMGLGHVLLLGARYPALLHLATLCCGLAYGALWALLPTLVSELFGLAAFASTYTAYSLAVSSAALLLSKELASRVAEAHTPLPPPPVPGAAAPPPPACFGDGCYRMTHLVVIGCCAVGAVCVAVVSQRTRAFYRRRLSANVTVTNDITRREAAWRRCSHEASERTPTRAEQ